MNLMLEPDAVKLLAKYGIPYPKNAFVENRARVSAEAEALGYPVVMKIVSPDIIHKSDAGGVVVDIKNKAEAETAYDSIMASVKRQNVHADIRGVLLCQMVTNGVEVIIGTTVDDIFGPAIMFGLGGVFVEVLKDVTFRICPVDKQQATKMIREIKGFDILNGVRGRARLDIDGLAELVANVSQLMTDNPAITAIDLNPVRVYTDHLMVLDARIIG